MIEANERNELAQELQHWEQQYDSEMSGYNEAPEAVQRVLQGVREKLDAAREALRHPDADQRAMALDELRAAFKKLDRKGSAGGPPMA